MEIKVDAVKLESGQTYDLDTDSFPVWKMGLGWESFGDDVVDLDASAVILDKQGKYMDSCYFAKLKILNNALQHSGDNRDGLGEGDDEQITVNLRDLSDEVGVICFLVTSYSGDTFAQVETAEANLYLEGNPKSLVNMCMAAKDPNATALALCRLCKNESGKWDMSALYKPVSGRSFADLVPEVQILCKDIIPDLQVEQPPKSIVLSKGETITLDKNLSSVTIGLGWDFVDKSIDLDASVVTYSHTGGVIKAVFYDDKVGFGGAIKHSGDNLTGKGSGDDEQIAVRFQHIPPTVSAICVCVTSYSGDSFTQIKGAFVRIINSDKSEIARYPLSDLGDLTAYTMCVLFRDIKQGCWRMKAIGQPGNGSTWQNLSGSMGEVVKNLKLSEISEEEAKDNFSYAGHYEGSDGGCCIIL